MPNTLLYVVRVGINCAKNVYGERKLSGKVTQLRTLLWDIPHTHGYKRGTSTRLLTQLFPTPVHSLRAVSSPVYLSLYPLSTGPIISSHELRKERNY